MSIESLEIPRRFGLQDYTWVVMSLDQAVQRGAQRVLLDFRQVERAYPDGMLPLIATLTRLREDASIAFDVALPQSRQLRGVFDGVGWSHYLVDGTVDFPDLPGSTRKFTPARPFMTPAQLDLLRGSIFGVLITQGRLARWLPEAIQWALWEVMENVVNHAHASAGWVQASTFLDRRHINILVVDAGIGIRESLSGVFPGLSDQMAIKRAVEEGVTRDPNSNAGFGLTGCRAIVASNRGQMTVYSGACQMTQESVGANKPELRRYVNTLAPHQGTIVELALRMDMPVDLAEALGQDRPVPVLELEHDTGLEFVFRVGEEAANLGTRESGRELRNKVLNLSQVESEERIVLDFDGVDVVSSSFADEFLAKLAAEVGREVFLARFEVRHMSPSVRAVALPIIWLRLPSV